ncbi:MAG: tetratricopeptide repeat protein [Candidatus Omnitrophota bacterium]|nr:tetratricopeptide repeat protein [Candidatus Omnitrophota bacterium]
MEHESQIEQEQGTWGERGVVRGKFVWVMLGVVLVVSIGFGVLFVQSYLELLGDGKRIEQAMQAGEYKKAEALLKAYQAKAPQDLTTHWNLATVYGSTNRIELASREIEELLRQDPNFDVTTQLIWLATQYFSQGKYPEAESYYQRALAIVEKASAPDDVMLMDSLEGLADLFSWQGKYAEAEPLYKRLLAMRETALGTGHLSLVRPLVQLTFLYDVQGRYAEAASLCQRTLVINEQILGPSHPDTTNTLHVLASIEENSGRYDEAGRSYKRLLEIWEKTRGSNHASVAAVLMDYAGLLRKVGDVQRAELMEERAKNIRLQGEGAAAR